MINHVIGSAIGLAMHPEFCNGQKIDNHCWCQLFWFSYLIWNISERSAINSNHVTTGVYFWSNLWQQFRQDFGIFLDALVAYTSKWKKQFWPAALQNKVTPEAGLWLLYTVIQTCKNCIRSDPNNPKKWREEIDKLIAQFNPLPEFIETCSLFVDKMQLQENSQPLYFDSVWLGGTFLHFSRTDRSYRTWSLPLPLWAHDFFIWAVLAKFDKNANNYGDFEIRMKNCLGKVLSRESDKVNLERKLQACVDNDSKIVDKEKEEELKKRIKEVLQNYSQIIELQQ
jgi:hypothetical protein